MKAQFIENYSLPSNYDTTYLNLIARDPQWVHAYWEVSTQSLNDVKNRIGDVINDSTFILRMYDITLIDFNGNNANHSYDIDVGLQHKSWYINVWADNVSYCADLGFRTPDGQFFPVTRSNQIVTQRRSFSNRHDLIWMNVQDGTESNVYAYADNVSQIGPDKQLKPKKRSSRIKWDITEEDIKAYYADLFPLLRMIRAGRHKKRRLPPQIGMAQRYQLEQADADQSVFFKKYIIGASEELAERFKENAGSEQVQNQGASEQLSPKQRSFYFEIGTELIVYGKTEPNAQVWHGSKQIPLRPDGTFSLRFALPDDTKIPLDFKAISNDKVEQRKIQTAGIRTKTFYAP